MRNLKNTMKSLKLPITVDKLLYIYHTRPILNFVFKLLGNRLPIHSIDSLINN